MIARRHKTLADQVNETLQDQLRADTERALFGPEHVDRATDPDPQPDPQPDLDNHRIPWCDKRCPHCRTFRLDGPTCDLERNLPRTDGRSGSKAICLPWLRHALSR